MSRKPSSSEEHVREVLKRLTRRDFIEGMLRGAGGLAAAGMGHGLVLSGCAADASTDVPESERPPGTPPSYVRANDNKAAFKGDSARLGHALRDGRTFPTPEPEPGPALDCVIVGSGMSGLCAAWWLVRNGVDPAGILILEKDGEPGGTTRADAIADGLVAAGGAAYTVFPYNEGLFTVYEALGVLKGFDADGEPVIDPSHLIPEPGNNVHVGGQWVRDGWNAIDALPLGPGARAGLRACRDEIIRLSEHTGSDGGLAFDTPNDASTADEELRRLDTLTFAEWVAENRWSPEVSAFWNPYARSAFGLDTDKLSAWAALNFLTSEFSPGLSRPGGNSWIVNGLLDLIGRAQLRRGFFVSKVVNEGDEVLVTTFEPGDRAVTRRAKTVILATPQYISERFTPELHARAEELEERLGYEPFRYSPYLVANVSVGAVPRSFGYDNWLHGTGHLATDFIVADWQLRKSGERPWDAPGVLTAYCPLTWATARHELLARSFDDWALRVLSDLDAVAPESVDTVTRVDLYRWGHPFVQATPGFIFGEARTTAQQPIGRIHFAHNDVDGLPAFENSLGAGMRAANEVLARLGV